MTFYVLRREIQKMVACQQFFLAQVFFTHFVKVKIFDKVFKSIALCENCKSG